MNNLLITNHIKKQTLLYQKSGYHKGTIPSRMVKRFYNQDWKGTCIGFVSGVVSNTL